MIKIVKKNKKSKIRIYVGTFTCILLLFIAIYLSPNFVAKNLSPDGILELTTISQINFIRLSLSLLGTTTLLIIALYIIKPKFLYSLQLKISKTPLLIKLILSKGSVREIRESLMESEAKDNARNLDLRIRVSKRVITRSLIAIVILLHIVSAFAAWLRYKGSTFILSSFYIKLFWVNSEGKVPTWYSACSLLFCAMLLSIISFLKRQSRDPHFWYWVGLSLIFAFLSLDEATSVHEMTGHFLRKTFEPIGIFYFAWVILGIPFVIIFGIFYLKFTLNLQKRTRTLFIVAFIIYVGGALGLEIAGAVFTYNQKASLVILIMATMEEVLEMSGIIIFIYALLDYIEVHLKSKEIRLRFIN